MIEDKFGAELLGLQLPASSPGRLPPLQAAEPTSPPRLHPALPDSCTLCPSPLLLFNIFKIIFLLLLRYYIFFPFSRSTFSTCNLSSDITWSLVLYLSFILQIILGQIYQIHA